eukprot:CAMPEP_0184981850 /NCGR_PEP_ID=MMETSP1098-20130426/11438_1 /TAXON_ID=89044 /ORGANISM="Spumella elongata, Strain CCAP 955/1" /LENGTH=1398 /DNA_ID=CAMNT_0027505457 /DNA_START=27 /DNA_END=4223 /DNA_ORIENTATION=+
MSSESVCNLSYLTGNFYECSPAFVQNSEVILFAAGSIVNAVSSTTGNVVGVFREHHSLITAISVVEGANEVTVYSASVDGVIYAWNLNTLQVKSSFNVGVPVYDLASIINSPSETEKLVVVSSVAKASVEKKRKFAVLNFDVASQKVTTKLASLQFPRRCTAVLKIPLARILEATGQVLSMEALYQQDQAAIETVLVVASSRKISFIPLSSQQSGSKHKNAPGVVHFVPDVDSRRGAITCVAASSYGDGVLVTGFEKGSIVVWHNIVQYYLSALSQTLNSASAAPAVDAGSLSKKEEKKRNKKMKALLAAESTVAMPISTTLHWHAHSVHTVSLTTDGSTLYSGGAEGVLVVWHNINTTSSTGATKSFFPRLGCPISFLTNNSSAGLLAGINVAVTTTDNAVHVINTATMREDWTARSLCITSRRESVPRKRALKNEAGDAADSAVDPTNEEEVEDEHQYLGINRAAVSRSQAHTLPFIQSDYHWRCSLTVEPRSQWLVCNGYPGQLQAFDRNTQALAHAYSIVDYTRVSKKEANSKMFVPSISHSQFLKHQLGWFLGTVDVRKGSELEAECSLKFFEWSDVQSKYRLGAQMDNPHGPHRVTSLAFAGASSSADDNINNNNNASPVLAATASVDGTVKVWRAERNDVSAPPTLTTSAKQRQQQLTVSNTSANSGNSAGETEAALPLKWLCAYSFKYRDSPATSVAFSRDGTLLAVAHRNLLSLWDPATVTMKASIVCPTSISAASVSANASLSTSNSILYTAFIEPKAASTLGGGCGSAYVFVGTQTSISVYDLLTLQLVWTLSGEKYTAFAVAADESQLPSSHVDAWIAVSLTTTTNASGNKSGANETDTEASVDGQSKQSEQHKVLLFSPYSSTPLAAHTLPAKASSLVFCPTNSTNDANDGEGSGRGIAVATESCEMLFLTVGAKNNTNAVMGKTGKVKQLAAKVGEQAATVYKVSVPALASTQQSEVVLGLNSNSKNGKSNGVQGVPLPTTKPGWLKDYFDEHSENIPSLGAISSGFFRNFHSTAPSTTASAVAGTSSANSAAAPATSKASRKRSAQQMSASVITPAAVAVPQALWDEALSGVFAPSSATSTNAAAKAVATPKKAAPAPAVVAEVVPATTPAKKSATPAAAAAAPVVAAPLPAVTPKKAAAAPVEAEQAAPVAPASAAKAKKTPKKAAPEVVVEEVAVVEEAMEVVTEEPAKTVKGAKKTSKIPHAVVPSSLQTINEDEEMVVEETPVVEDSEVQEDTSNKRRKTARSNSVSSVASTASAPAEASTPTAATKATRVAASKIPARAPRVAASPSMTSSVVVPEPLVAEVPVKAAAVSKLKAPTEVKLTKRTLPAATAVKPVDDSSDSSVSGLRRSSRARSNSNLSEDSAVSTGSATRKSARTSAR